jgi:hypothetical protein
MNKVVVQICALFWLFLPSTIMNCTNIKSRLVVIAQFLYKWLCVKWSKVK